MVLEIWNATDNFLSLWIVFFPFTTFCTQKMKIFKSLKTLQNIIILQMFTINDSHMIYGFSDMECSRQFFFVILDHFLSFYHPSNPKNENFIKLKKEPLEISSFYTSVTKIMIIFYTVSWIWHVTNVIIFHFGLFFAPLPPNSPKNKN